MRPVETQEAKGFDILRKNRPEPFAFPEPNFRGVLPNPFVSLLPFSLSRTAIGQRRGDLATSEVDLGEICKVQTGHVTYTPDGHNPAILITPNWDRSAHYVGLRPNQATNDQLLATPQAVHNLVAARGGRYVLSKAILPLFIARFLDRDSAFKFAHIINALEHVPPVGLGPSFVVKVYRQEMKER